jgi:hypothetical protein
MRTFLASVLSVIAVGVLLIAYGLLSPRAAAAPYGSAVPYGLGNPDAYQVARPMPVHDLMSLNDQAAYDQYVAWRRAALSSPYPASAYPTTASPASLGSEVGDVRPVRAFQTYPAPRRTSRASIERSSGRDWKKTALVIGGSTAAGAGLGAIFGGRKGALIGAAIGGGASGLYEATKR